MSSKTPRKSLQNARTGTQCIFMDLSPEGVVLTVIRVVPKTLQDGDGQQELEDYLSIFSWDNKTVELVEDAHVSLLPRSDMEYHVYQYADGPDSLHRFALSVVPQDFPEVWFTQKGTMLSE